METQSRKTVEVPAPESRPLAAVPAPAQPKRRRPFLILGAVAALVVLGIGGYLLVTAGEETTDDAQVEADVIPLAARVSGQVLHVNVEENQKVTKGQLIVEIDDADYRARADQAEAEVAAAQAQAQAADAQQRVAEAHARGGFSTARAGVTTSSAGVSSAAAQVAQARAALTRAEAEARQADIGLKRAQDLRAQNAVPQERLDNAQAENDVAHAALAQARAAVTAAEDAQSAATARVAEARGRLDESAPVDAQIASARANAALAHARVKTAEAGLALAKLQLSYTKIVAPQDGTVSKLGVHEGQLVQAGMPVVEQVPERMYLVANFKETQVGKMHPGQKAEIEIDAFPGKKLSGQVESISAGTGARFSLLPPDNASGNFVKVVQRVPVRIALVDRPAELPLRAGLSANVTVTVK